MSIEASEACGRASAQEFSAMGRMLAKVDELAAERDRQVGHVASPNAHRAGERGNGRNWSQWKKGAYKPKPRRPYDFSED